MPTVVWHRGGHECPEILTFTLMSSLSISHDFSLYSGTVGFTDNLENFSKFLICYGKAESFVSLSKTWVNYSILLVKILTKKAFGVHLRTGKLYRLVELKLFSFISRVEGGTVTEAVVQLNNDAIRKEELGFQMSDAQSVLPKVPPTNTMCRRMRKAGAGIYL